MPTSFQDLLFSVFVGSRQSHGCEVVLHCGFDLPSLMISGVSFPVLMEHLHVFFGEISIHLLSFLKFVFNWKTIALQCCGWFLLYNVNQLEVYIYSLHCEPPSHPSFHWVICFLLELSCRSSFCILDINPFSHV